MSDQIPFADFDVERDLVAAVLLDASVIPAAQAAGVTHESFADVALAAVWEAACALFERRDVLDAVSVVGELRARNRLQSIGGVAFLHALTDQLPTIAHAERHAHEIVRLHTARKTLAVCERAVGRARAGAAADAWSESLIAELQKTTGEQRRTTAVPMHEALAAWWQPWESLEPDSPPRPARFGIPSIDREIGDGRGLEGGRLYMIAARPGMGKSALALGAGLATARGGARVLKFSLEMPAGELVLRSLSSVARIDSLDVARKRLSPADIDALTAAAGVLHGAPLYIDDAAGLNVHEIRARTLAFRARHGDVDLVMVDHLNIVGADPSAPRGENEAAHLSKITGGLKRLSKEMGVPVVLLVQLNRDCEKRPDKRPQLSDLRGSGAIEQDADVVMFIYRDDVYNPDTADRGIAEVAIAKQRSGRTPVIKTRWERELTTFSDLPPDLRSVAANDDAEPFGEEGAA